MLEELIQNSWQTSVALAPWLLLGALISGIMHVWIPPGWVQGNLQGKRGIIKAIFVGVPLPLCSCGVIPAGIGLKKEGASDGASIGFLISTPQTGVDSIFVSGSFLGWPFAVFKVISAFILGLIGGLFTELKNPSTLEIESHVETTEKRKSLKQGAIFSLEIIQSIWRWIVFGILISALIQTVFPEKAFQDTLLASGLFAAPFALLISLPMYVCATASVPIAAALVQAGMPPSAALVFLMAGPATNLATIGAIRKTFGKKTLLIYLSTIILGSLLLSYAFGFVISKDQITETIHDHTTSSMWEIAAVATLAGLFLFFAAKESFKWLKSKKPTSAKSNQIEVLVDGITCNKCVSTIETELQKIEGVTRVMVTRNPDKVLINGSANEQTIETELQELGYPAILK